MSPALKPLSAQTIVLTGATSGIGLATARLAAKRGAKLLLIARNGQALRALCEELKARGGVADWAEADVADIEALKAAAAKAETLYGGFDTWINNAGVSIYGGLEATPMEDQKRLFDTNFWGVVNGSRIALQHLKARSGGGTIVNLGSILSDVAMPVQGVYSASKHAVKGFTNALRMELRREAPEVSVTLIKPSAIDTPYREHARNFTGAPVKNPPPVYAAPLAAEAILYAAEHPIRELTVGGGGRALALIGEHLPLISEPLLAWAAPKLSRARDDAPGGGGDALHKAGRDLRERSPYLGVRQTSLYTTAQMNPRVTAAVAAGAAAVLLLALQARDSLRMHKAGRRAVARWRARHEPRQG